MIDFNSFTFLTKEIKYLKITTGFFFTRVKNKPVKFNCLIYHLKNVYHFQKSSLKKLKKVIKTNRRVRTERDILIN